MHRMLRLLLVASLVTVSGVMAVAQGAAATFGTPQTIPALRNWSAGGDGYTFAPDARVVAADGTLAKTARTLAADLSSLTGVDVPAVVSGTAVSGDIALRRGQVTGGAEGYRMTVAPMLVIEGNTDDGVFLGTRSILQLLRQSRTIPGGTATDWPAYRERGLMVDVGRKHLSLPWLRARIRDMSYLKMNHLHLHLSDRLGFRLESESHPEVTSAQHYSQREMRDLIAYAARYHVRIVPELDFPGHMDAILAAHPELKLVSRSGVVDHGAIDLSNPASYELMRDLIEEFAPQFPGEYWHIGADEYVTDFTEYPQLAEYAKAHYGPDATGKDAYLGFVNWANGVVRETGKTARMWNDGLKPGGSTLEVDNTVVVEHWSNGDLLPLTGDAYTPSQLVAAGHQVQNSAYVPTQYTVGDYGSLFNTPASVLYDLWDPNTFVGGKRLSDAERPYNLGAKLQIWCDGPDGKTEDQIAADNYERLRVMAQHTWRSNSAPLYLFFAPVISAVGSAPA